MAAVVCIAASNGGTTSQDLKTGYLVGATPRLQQIAILVGALTSALVIGVTLLLLNNAGTVYTKKAGIRAELPVVSDVANLTQMEQPAGSTPDDPAMYHVLHVARGAIPGVPAGQYLVDDGGQIRYLVDPAINGRVHTRDDGVKVSNKFEAPKTRLMAPDHRRHLESQPALGIGADRGVDRRGAGVGRRAVAAVRRRRVSADSDVGADLRRRHGPLDGRAAQGSAQGRSGEQPRRSCSARATLPAARLPACWSRFSAFAPDRFNAVLDLGKHLPASWNASNWPSLAMFGCWSWCWRWWAWSGFCEFRLRDEGI